MPKTIFIPIFTQAESTNLLLSEMLTILKNTPNLKIIIFTKEKKVDFYRERFGAPNVLIEPMTDLEHDRGRFRQLLTTAAFNSIPTRTIWMRQNRIVVLNPTISNLVGLPFKKLCWILGHTRVWREFLRSLEPLFHEDTIWDEAFAKYKPDLVFATNMIHGTSIALIKAAKRRETRTIGMTKSWDNFTSKTLLRMKPDHLIVNNPLIKREARAIGDMPEKKVTVVGLPQYDKYMKPEWHLTREEFFKRFGLHPDKKLLVYFMGGPLAIHDPRDHVKMISEAIERGDLPPSTLFVRSHPKYDVNIDDLKLLPHVKIHIPGEELQGFKGDREFDEDDVKVLISTLYHADVTLNTGSTMTIEATIFDKPIILIGFDGYTKKPHYESIDHTMDITHYRYLVESGATARVVNEHELVEAIKTYLKTPAENHEGRKRLFDEQVWKTDGNSGKRIAGVLLNSLT